MAQIIFQPGESESDPFDPLTAYIVTAHGTLAASYKVTMLPKRLPLGTTNWIDAPGEAKEGDDVVLNSGNNVLLMSFAKNYYYRLERTGAADANATFDFGDSTTVSYNRSGK